MDKSVADLIRDSDLDIWVSQAFVITGSLASFVEIREAIEDILGDKAGEKLIHGTASARRLFIVKEDDYNALQTLKENR